jgi:hypothetical protein
LLGQWPYRCEDCGTNFLLKKRYVKAKSERSADGEASSRHSSRQMLTAPVAAMRSMSGMARQFGI